MNITLTSTGSIPPGKLMGPQPLPWGSSSTMKMLFLQSLQRPKWAASQVALSFSTLGLSTAQWSVTTAASIADMPTMITTDVILTLVACSSNMFLVFSKPMMQVRTSLLLHVKRWAVKVVFVLFVFRSLMSRGSHVLTKASLLVSSPLSFSPRLFLSHSLLSAWWLVKRGQITVP